MASLGELAQDRILAELEALGLADTVDEHHGKRVHDRLRFDVRFDPIVGVEERDDLLAGLLGPADPLQRSVDLVSSAIPLVTPRSGGPRRAQAGLCGSSASPRRDELEQRQRDHYDDHDCHEVDHEPER